MQCWDVRSDSISHLKTFETATVEAEIVAVIAVYLSEALGYRIVLS